jgi:hypothetical protein
LSYENVAGHTAGFLGLIIALMLITIQNCLYILDKNMAYHILGGLTGTRCAVIIFLISNLSVSACKCASATHIVQNGRPADWALKPFGPVVAGKAVDILWMLFNALLPIFSSYHRSRCEGGIEIIIEKNMPQNPRLDDSTSPPAEPNLV